MRNLSQNLKLYVWLMLFLLGAAWLTVVQAQPNNSRNEPDVQQQVGLFADHTGSITGESEISVLSGLDVNSVRHRDSDLTHTLVLSDSKAIITGSTSLEAFSTINGAHNTTHNEEKSFLSKPVRKTSGSILSNKQTSSGNLYLSHSASYEITSDNSVACQDKTNSFENSYYRVFDLVEFGINEELNVTSVEFGVQRARGGSGEQLVAINLYSLNGPFELANLTQIGTFEAFLPDDALTIFSAPIQGIVPAGGTLVVEVFTPNGEDEGNLFLIGSNAEGQTGLSYIRAPECGFNEPSDLTEMGFSDMHIVMNVYGELVQPIPTATRTPTPILPTPTVAASNTPSSSGSQSITQSHSQEITAEHTVYCGPPGSDVHSQNSYYRVFHLPDFGINNEFNVSTVEFGVERAIGANGNQPVTLNLYTLNGSFELANLSQIGTFEQTLSDRTLAIASAPIEGTVPAGGTLVVEVFTPNGQDEGNIFRIGSNNQGENASSYVRAPTCNLNEPTDLAEIGFEDTHLVMNVHGTEGETPLTPIATPTRTPTVTPIPTPEFPSGRLSHSYYQEITSNSVHCNASENSSAHSENSYYRFFDLTDFGINNPFNVAIVEFGVEFASGAGGAQPVTVNLYTLSGAFELANLTPIGSANVNLPDQAFSLATVPVYGSAPAGTTLVVEVFTPDGEDEQNIFFIGSNDDGQSAPSYIRAPTCDFNEPTDLADMGFEYMHIVMNVYGSEGNNPTPTPLPTATPTTPPSPSESIDVRAEASQESINVQWDLVGSLSGQISKYQVHRNANNDPFTLITSITDNQYTDNDSALTAGSTYCYQIKAIDRANNVIGESNTACTKFGALRLWVPDEVVPAGNKVVLPINLANGNGLCIGAMDITLSYDPTIIKATDIVSPTIYTNNYAFSANSTTPGQIKISSVTGSGQCERLYGGGSLFLMNFDVIGEQGESSPLSFIGSDQQTEIHHEDQKSAVDLELKNGQVLVGRRFIRGDIDGSEFVRSFDAKLALLIASGSREANTQQQQTCDVNGDGVCNSADSSLILCYAAFQNWDQCGGVNNQHINQQRQNMPITVAIESGSQNGQTFIANVKVTDAPDFAGGDFTFMYDATQMKATGVSLSTLINGFSLERNFQQTGLIRVSLAKRDPIAVNGTILQLEFTVTSGISNIDLGSVRLHDATGRDFETSALQREIELVPYEAGSAAQSKLYLPLVIR